MGFFKEFGKKFAEDTKGKKEEVQEAINELLEDNIPGLREETGSEPVNEDPAPKAEPTPSTAPSDFTLIEREPFKTVEMRYVSQEALSLATLIFLKNQGNPQGNPEAKLMSLIKAYGLTTPDAEERAKKAEEKMNDLEKKLAKIVDEGLFIKRELKDARAEADAAQGEAADLKDEAAKLRKSLSESERIHKEYTKEWGNFRDELAEWVSLDTRDGHIVGVKLKKEQTPATPPKAPTPDPVKTPKTVATTPVEAPTTPSEAPTSTPVKPAAAPAKATAEPAHVKGATPEPTTVMDVAPEPAHIKTTAKLAKAQAPAEKASRLPHPAVCYIDEDGQIHDREYWKLRGKPDWDREIHWRLPDSNEFSDDEVPAEIAKRFRRGEQFDHRKDDEYANAAALALRAMNGSK